MNKEIRDRVNAIADRKLKEVRKRRVREFKAASMPFENRIRAIEAERDKLLNRALGACREWDYERADSANDAVYRERDDLLLEISMMGSKNSKAILQAIRKYERG